MKEDINEYIVSCTKSKELLLQGIDQIQSIDRMLVGRKMPNQFGECLARLIERELSDMKYGIDSLDIIINLYTKILILQSIGEPTNERPN